MPRNEHTVEIERPPADVFPHLVASERRLAWMGPLSESEQVTEGEPGLGTRFRDVFRDSGQRIEIEAEVVEWDPNQRLGLRLTSSAFVSSVRQELTDAGGRTRLATTIDTEYKSRAARLMSGVVTRHAQRRLEEDLARLKAMVERGA